MYCSLIIFFSARRRLQKKRMHFWSISKMPVTDPECSPGFWQPLWCAISRSNCSQRCSCQYNWFPFWQTQSVYNKVGLGEHSGWYTYEEYNAQNEVRVGIHSEGQLRSHLNNFLQVSCRVFSMDHIHVYQRGILLVTNSNSNQVCDHK